MKKEKKSNKKPKYVAHKTFEPMKQDETLPKAILCDIDETLVAKGNRSPYDASLSDLLDSPKEYVAELVNLYFQAGYKIIFCSGRMAKDREPTIRLINRCVPNVEYVLFTRQDGDQRADSIIKWEIFEKDIQPNYWVKTVIDDRLKVCRMWHERGLDLLRVGDPDSDF